MGEEILSIAFSSCLLGKRTPFLKPLERKQKNEFHIWGRGLAYLMICPSSSGVAGLKPKTIWHTWGGGREEGKREKVTYQ